jgi:hypothetical protein
MDVVGVEADSMYATKDKVRVMIIMGSFRVEGDIHILVGSRLTDALNSKAKDFFALTNSQIRRLEDETVIYAPAYLAINREAITAIFPLEGGW